LSTHVSISELEDDQVAFWEAKQRELVTSVVDYNLETLASLIDNDTIELAPQFQRRFRWDRKRQSDLIESFLMNVPVPPVFLNEDIYEGYSVIDGKQRLTAVHQFLKNKLRLTGLKIFSELNGKSFSTLPRQLQAVIRTRPTLRAVIVLKQSDPDIKYQVFRRLNKGGVNLSAQEMRNSLYRGKYNDLMMKLAADQTFVKLVGTRAQDSALWRKMGDAELVLRYMTFKDSWQVFRSDMERMMDQKAEFNADPRNVPEDEWEGDRMQFLRTTEAVEAAFGGHAYRRWYPAKAIWGGRPSAALYDAQMFACQGLDPEELRSRRGAMLVPLKALFEDSDFQESIVAGTNTPRLVQRKVEMTRGIIDSAFRD